VLALALAGAVAAAIVHGVLSSSGSQPQQVAVRGGVPHVKRALAPDLHPPVDSSGGSGGATWAQALPSVAGGPALPSVAGAPTRLQHTDASLEVRVKNTSAATTRATRIATSLGGYAQSVNYNSAPGGGGTASIVLRVPAQNVKAALARLEGLGTLVSQNLSVTDLEHDLQLESAQIAQLRHTIAALRTALHDRSLPDAQRVALALFHFEDPVSTPAICSFDITWSGPVTDRSPVSETPGSEGELVLCQATMQWSASNDLGFSFETDPNAPTTSVLAQLGKVRNGVFAD